MVGAPVKEAAASFAAGNENPEEPKTEVGAVGVGALGFAVDAEIDAAGGNVDVVVLDVVGKVNEDVDVPKDGAFVALGFTSNLTAGVSV